MPASGQLHIAIFANFPAPGAANPNDIWFASDTGLTWWADQEGNLHQLLNQTPFVMAGPQGPQGVPGPQGPQGPALFFQGNWQPSPVVYRQGSIVSYNNSLYLLNAVSDIDLSPPASNPFWTLLGSLPVQQSEILVCCDGAGQTISPGFKGYVRIPYALSLASWSLYADQPGSAVIDLKWCADGSFPSTVSIVAGAGPSLISQQKNEGSVSTWSPVTFNAGDILEVDLLSASTVTFLTLALGTTATN